MRLPFAGNYPLTQAFGVNPQDYKQFGMLGHNGRDYGLPTGTPVLAAEDGQVTVLTDPPGFGNYIELRSASYKTIYAHLKQATVATGTWVKAGDQIGISNNTGNSSGPHLHFGVKPIIPDKNNGYFGAIDPAPLLNQGDSDVIQDRDNEFYRWLKLFVQIRGRSATREEFRKAAVGQTWLRAMEILSDSPEADAATDYQNWGRTAKNDRWDLQIANLLQQNSELHKTVDGKTVLDPKEAEDLKAWKIMGQDYLKQLNELRAQVASGGTELKPGTYIVK